MAVFRSYVVKRYSLEGNRRIAVYEKNVNDARIRLNRIGGELRGYFSRMGSIARDMDANDRLRIIHDFFRQGEETYFNFDFKEMMKKGYDFRDYVCPDSFENHSDYFKMGSRFGRVLLFRDFASYGGKADGYQAVHDAVDRHRACTNGGGHQGS